jgi:aldose 1-epimerase
MDPSRYAVDVDGAVFMLRDRIARSTATLKPAHGNTVTALTAYVGGRVIDVLVTPDRPFGPQGYAAGVPILLPFPNRVRSGKYTFAGVAHELQRNERDGANHIHGFVRAKPWHVVGQGADASEGAWVDSEIALDAFPDVRSQYPFACTVRLRTSVMEGALVQRITARNTGGQALPLGCGLHPWFPASFGSPRSRTAVRVPAAARWELRDRLPTGRRTPVGRRTDLRRPRRLKDESFDDVYTQLLPRADGWTEAAVLYLEQEIEIRVEASPEFREWVVYAPRDRAVVCLEPYSCATDAVNLVAHGIEAGLVSLGPGEEWRAEVRISAHVLSRERLPA